MVDILYQQDEFEAIKIVVILDFSKTRAAKIVKLDLLPCKLHEEVLIIDSIGCKCYLAILKTSYQVGLKYIIREFVKLQIFVVAQS